MTKTHLFFDKDGARIEGGEKVRVPLNAEEFVFGRVDILLPPTDSASISKTYPEVVVQLNDNRRVTLAARDVKVIKE